MNDDLLAKVLRPLIKLVVSVVGLLLARQILSLAPGAERTVPEVGIRFSSVLSAIVGLIIVSVLLYYSYTLATAIGELSIANESLRTAGARCLLLVAGFVSLLVIYGNVSTLVEELYAADHAVHFALDAGFLLASLGLLLAFGGIVLRHFDPIITAIINHINRVRSDDSRTTSSATADETNSSAVTCVNCGSELGSNASFCGNCGQSLDQ